MQSRFDWNETDRRRFEEVLQANPGLYALLRDLALKAKRAGRKRMGIAALVEVARWHTDVETQGMSFKIDNTMRAWLARELMKNEKDLAGFFETRQSKADAA